MARPGGQFGAHNEQLALQGEDALRNRGGVGQRTRQPEGRDGLVE